MKKALFFLCLVFLFINSKIIYSHGFGVHAAHLSSILALNDQYKTLIENPRYQPYFIYGSIFPDIQYAVNYKNVLQNLYQKIRAVTLRDATNGWIPDNAYAFDGLTYEINTDQIPDSYPFGIDTHNDKYALAFAEYLLEQCAPIDPPGPNPGSNGSTIEHDARNMKLAFALGYYAHLSEDIACHDFMIPRITASLNLGDLELIKSTQSQAFSEDPNGQLEGIIEGIMDYYYGNNALIADQIYNEIWVGRSQLEPTITQMDFTKGYAHLFFNGPTPTYYDAQGGWPEMNPVLLFFHSVLNTWYNTNPFNLPTGPDGYRKPNISPLSATGLYQLATVFRFVNRFYPAVVGQPFNGKNRLDEVLADWVSNHLDLSDATNAWGVGLSWFLLNFPGILLAQEINVSALSGLAYPSIVDGLTPQLSQDARSMVALMLCNMSKADELATNYPERINIESYNKLKQSSLFTNPTGLLNSLWIEYKALGTKIYEQVGPGGKWYTDWSPWHKQSMVWGVLSSLNNSLPDIYTSNQNVAVYDAYFQVNSNRITGPQLPTVFQNNPIVKANIELYNTSNVSSESITLKVKRDHNSTDYSLDPLKTSTTFTIDHDPLLYNTTDRKKVELIVPSVSLADLVNYRGYYMEAVKNSNNKVMFSSSFEQYQERLDLTSNYAKLYGSYDQDKWPVSLGLLRSAATVNLNAAQFPEGGGSGGSYKINGIAQNSITGCIDDYINLEAIPPSGWTFLNWSDGNWDNPRTYKIVSTNTTLFALYKYLGHSNSTNAYSNPSQRKFIQTPDGVKHICYESMGKVWYELSTDGGTTWILGNGGKPLSSADAKNPSMSFYGNQIGIVYQENSGYSFKIKMALFYGSNYSSSVFSTAADDDIGLDYSYNANPVVAWGYNAKVVVVWSGMDLCARPSGRVALKYAYGSASSNGISWYMQCGIGGTDENSINPTIVANYTVYTNPFYFHIAWEQVVNSSTSKIIYSMLTADAENYLQPTLFDEASYNSGYSKNYQPSILLRQVGDSYLPYITWLGYRSTPSVSSRAIMRYKQYGSWSPLSIYGGNSVQSFSINNAGYLYGQYVLGLGWSEPVSQGSTTYFNKAVKIGSSTTINTLSTTGKDLQINNSTSYSSMFVNSFQSKTLPYSFSLSQPFASLSKENSLAMLNAREGVVGKNGAQFFFALGDINANGQNVDFVEIPDSINVDNLEAINTYFVSKPITVNESSNLIYGVEYGIADSVLCSSVLANNGNIAFKVLLIDDNTNEVLDVFDEVTYSGNNVYQYNNIGYQVNLTGIGERTIRLGLAVNTNIDFDYSLSNRISDQSLVAKTSYQTIIYKGKTTVTDYALEQNYPNPFNPSTKISWQSPVAGHQTLKVYDILGNEVATLVDEFREAGRYEINFDAGILSSGVYIYKIQAGDFVSSRKMILIK